jgi:hypothetical protein
VRDAQLVEPERVPTHLRSVQHAYPACSRVIIITISPATIRRTPLSEEGDDTGQEANGCQLHHGHSRRSRSCSRLFSAGGLRSSGWRLHILVCCRAVRWACGVRSRRRLAVLLLLYFFDLIRRIRSELLWRVTKQMQRCQIQL